MIADCIAFSFFLKKKVVMSLMKDFLRPGGLVYEQIDGSLKKNELKISL